MIRLKNTLPEMRTYEIPISAGAGFDRHTITTTKRSLVRPGEGARDGTMDVQLRPRSATRNVPRSITLCAAGTQGDTSEDLPDNVQHVEPFKSAVARRHILVLEVKPPAADPAATPQAVPTASSGAPDDAPKGESDKPADAGASDTTTTTRRKRGGEQ